MGGIKIKKVPIEMTGDWSELKLEADTMHALVKARVNARGGYARALSDARVDSGDQTLVLLRSGSAGAVRHGPQKPPFTAHARVVYVIVQLLDHALRSSVGRFGRTGGG